MFKNLSFIYVFAVVLIIVVICCLCWTRLAKRREILIFPRTAGNTGNSREILVIPGIYWEIGSSPTRKV